VNNKTENKLLSLPVMLIIPVLSIASIPLDFLIEGELNYNFGPIKILLYLTLVPGITPFFVIDVIVASCIFFIVHWILLRSNRMRLLLVIVLTFIIQIMLVVTLNLAFLLPEGL
jgi:hypothetical protein